MGWPELISFLLQGALLRLLLTNYTKIANYFCEEIIIMRRGGELSSPFYLDYPM